MRLDLFLKAARIVKRRTIAKELCDEGAVSLNGHPARAGRDVRPGDELEIRMRNRHVRGTVVEVPDRPAGRGSELFEVSSDVRVND